mgnify:CR=1 FL=1
MVTQAHDRQVSDTLPSSAKGPVLVTCARAPPQIGGTPTVMYELLRHFPHGSVVLVSKVQSARHSEDDRRLDVEHHQVGRLSSLAYHSLFQLVTMPLTLLSTMSIVHRMKEKPSSVLAVFPSLDFLAVSLVVCRLIRVPVFVYLHDCVLETAANPAERALARVVERWSFSHAKKVYSMSEPMRDYLRKRSMETEVLPHGVDVSLMREPMRSSDPTKVKLGFAGMVYETNLGAMRDFVEAKRRSGGKIELHVRCPRQSLDLMRTAGVLDMFDSAATLAGREEVLDFLAGCDVLVVPMSFESKVKKDLLTIFPTKVTDYWLAQRPIIVYGPDEYAFVTKAARDGYAVAVTERGPAAILSALEGLSSSSDVSTRLVRSARDKAEEHDSRAVAKRLMDDLGVK